MNSEKQTIQLIYQAIDSVNEMLSEEDWLSKTPETILSPNLEIGGLDSLSMVNFIVALEQIIAEEMDKTLSIVDDLRISDEHNPFASIAILADDIDSLLGCA